MRLACVCAQIGWCLQGDRALPGAGADGLPGAGADGLPGAGAGGPRGAVLQHARRPASRVPATGKVAMFVSDRG